MDKEQLRKYIREQKRAMPPEVIEEKSRELTRKLLSTQLYCNARTVYGYLSYNQEVRTMPLLLQALRDGKRVAVPKVFGDEMRFIYINAHSPVEKGYAGIPEPAEDGPVADDPAALVLMPGLAFDEKGNRMGYGGGFYDRFLSVEPGHPTVALCYDFQMVEHIPTQAHDIPVDLVIWA